MEGTFYETRMTIDLTRESAKSFALDDPESFTDFVMAYHPSVIIDYIKQCPKELIRFVKSGGLSEEDV